MIGSVRPAFGVSWTTPTIWNEWLATLNGGSLSRRSVTIWPSGGAAVQSRADETLVDERDRSGAASTSPSVSSRPAASRMPSAFV